MSRISSNRIFKKLILLKWNPHFPLLIQNMTSYSQSESVKKDKRFYAVCFRTLELDPDSSQDLVRRQYIRLVKKYHPDSAKTDSEKEMHIQSFHKIDEAYRELQKKFVADRKRDEECSGEYGLYYNPDNVDPEFFEEDTDVSKHTTPQHRQYLNNEGFGYGTPSQRQKQYQKMRAAKALENVNEHRVTKLGGGSDEDQLVAVQRKAVKRQRVQNAIDRLVEDLIVDAMAKGEFENLKGSGKPLPDRVIYNPYEDFTTQKMNQILAEGGFAPEWVMLKRDIENQKLEIRESLRSKSNLVFTRENCQLTPRQKNDWHNFLTNLAEKQVKKLNVNIDRFNLMVPLLNSQMVHFNLNRESNVISKTVIEENKIKFAKSPSEKVKAEDLEPPTPNFLSDLVLSWFFKK